MAIGVEKSLNEINIDLEKELRHYAKEDMSIAPDGFSAQRVENLNRFRAMWPKEFPPIEPNTPIFYLIDLIATMLTEMQLEPLKHIGDRVQDVVAKEMHTPEIKKQIEYYIEETVKTKIREYMNANMEKEHMMKQAFMEELKDL